VPDKFTVPALVNAIVKYFETENRLSEQRAPSPEPRAML
jgi:hypothetical protein